MGKNRQFVAVSIALAAVTMIAYWKAIGGGFVFDDKLYILGNPHVQNGLNWTDIRWAFTAWHASNWHPLTWISHMLDSRIWELNPLGHHLTSVLLHIANTVLLFALVRRMTGHLWRSAFVAALFALHPLHVESVAWVAERKDVLSTLFWILTMLAYVRYTERPGIGRYALVAGLFALGLMSKPMLVSLPIVLLLVDYWPLGRLGRSRAALVIEKLPLFMLSAASCAVTYLAQQAGGSVAVSEFPLGVRAANAVVAYVAYLWRMLLPIRLAALYPHPGATLPPWQVVGSAALLIGITALVIVLARRKPHLAVGWLWYLITLVPVIGLLQVGSQAMADRYTYVPLIGVFLALAGSIGPIRRERIRPASLGAGAVILACAVGTWHQTGFWRDEITLCRRAIAATGGNAVMHNNLGVALYEEGDLDGAIAEYRKGLGISSSYADLHTNLGNALSDKGQLDQAIAEYHMAIRLDSANPRIYNNLGTVLAQKGEVDEAIDAFRKAVEIEPEMAATHGNLARALMQVGKSEEALEEYRTAVDLGPGDPQLHLDFGQALMSLGSSDEAIAEFGQALWIRQDFPEAHLNMGVALINQGKPDEAIGHYRQALRSRPEYAEAHHNLAVALYSKGDYEGAWKEIALCRRHGLDPHPGFLEELGRAMSEP